MALGPVGEGQAMRGTIAFLIAGFIPIGALAADTCRAQVVATKLNAQEASAFMQNCKVLAKMVCEGRAIDQKVPDQARAAFLKTCLSTEVGK
jgi:hypothetical protein